VALSKFPHPPLDLTIDNHFRWIRKLYNSISVSPDNPLLSIPIFFLKLDENSRENNCKELPNVLVIIIFLLYGKTGPIYTNPMLGLWGYKIFKVKDKNLEN